MNSIKWRCPSNIALVKYWGKKPGQIPANPSISFTLSNACTDMELRWKKGTGEHINLDFYFEDKKNEKFREKIAKFLQSQLFGMPWLAGLELEIHSSNSFPHSAGIASSASSMGALALCLCSLEHALNGGLEDKCSFFTKASTLARLASGSASRSIYGGLVTWGAIDGLPGTSDEFASPLQATVHETFSDYYDAVLIVSREEKSVSSRAGHALMDAHPFAQVRYTQARENLARLIQAIADGNLPSFVDIVENEALTLHGLMMTSNPSVVLFKPNTWEIINRIRAYREQTGHQVCFTLDAGPNVHVLYPASIKNEVEAFINEELVVYCTDNYWISDKVGAGPLKIDHE